MSEVRTDIKFRCPCCQKGQAYGVQPPWESEDKPRCPECDIVMDMYQQVLRWELVKRFVREHG